VKRLALIVAGGSGTRMKSGIPKQFLPVNGRPVLMYTMEAFYQYDPDMQLILVLPENQNNAWKELCRMHRFNIPHDIGFGGSTRFHSVQRNVKDLPDDILVAVHDGVRPLVSAETIDRCFVAAEKYNNAVPCVDIPETMRKIIDNTSVQVDRTAYKLIQTPQVFHARILKIAYQQEYLEEFTDDAGVVEKAGYRIFLVEGNTENIKITFKKDLQLASSLLKP
jgi:2-C-methyl-D-erythritol 4-phosphate cytidylyltransferase